MGTKWWAIALVLLCTILTTTAQIFLKMGADKLPKLITFIGMLKVFDIYSISYTLITNSPLVSGIVLYAIGAAVLIIAFRGGEVTVIYPIFASSYIWVSILSAYFFSEPLGLLKIAGIFIVITGITFIAIGSKKGTAIQYMEAP